MNGFPGRWAVAGLLLAASWALTPAARAGSGVAVAVEAAGTLDVQRAQELLGRWVEELERPAPDAAAPLRVLSRAVLSASPLSPSSADEASWLLSLNSSPARHAVLARISRAGTRYSLEVLLRDLPGSDSSVHFVLLAEDSAGLIAAMEVAAGRVRAAAAGVGPVSGVVHAQQELGVEGGAESEPVAAVPGERRVVAVRIDGNRRIEADAIKAAIATQVGGPLRESAVARDIRRIYELGFFRDVQALYSDAEDGAIVTFVVEENPVIRRVTISGNENLDSDEIKDKLTLTVGSTIDYPLLLENQERMIAMYQAKGFYLIEVDYEVESLAEGIVGVNFEVREGKKLRLRAINFIGNDNLDDGDLLRVMQTKRWRWYSHVSRFWDKSGLYAEPIFLQDLDRVSRLYGDYGFIRVAVGQPDVEITEKGLEVNVEIVEGPQFFVGRIDAVGDESLNREQLLSQVGLKPGAVFNRSQLTTDVDQVRGFYEDRGFFDASVSPRTNVNPNALIIDVAFEVEKGELYFVDSIDIHGNTRTRDPVIRREMSLAEGELYSREAVRRSQRRVRRLGFFEEVEIEPRRLDEPGRVDLDVDVVERPTGSFSFGAGVGSTDGFVLTGSLRQDNLFGVGRAVNLSADVGSRNSRVLFSYVEPHVFGTVATLTSSISFLKREFIDFDEELAGFNFGLEYPLDESETIVGSGYSFTNREVKSISSFSAASLLQREESEGDSDTSQMSFSLRRDTRDDIRFPNTGQVTGVGLDFAGLGGLNEFLRAELRTSHWIPIGWLPFDSTFVLNSRLGWVIPFNDVDDFDLPPCNGADCRDFIAGNPEADELANIDDDLELPLTERYFLGGLGSYQLRGYKQRSVGPRRARLVPRAFADNPKDRAYLPVGVADNGGCLIADCNSIGDQDDNDFDEVDDTDVIGGNKIFLLNLELQFPISDELGLKGLTFVDMGNAYAESDGMNLGDLRYSIGGGIQWFSPFGPITIILGLPLNELDDEDTSVFEFSMGGSSF